ncbi:MAG: antibiotic biosynthesis monooxygenase [Candidatus Nephthysia bennettiae]|uniref:Antibiotic biosynthesis monooxygenase n=1 Tax=Candidatus Nephthysia bennettiae TaxID=3127016 RepID=A0A934NBN8_9BACT|nr:antibiotic biosynthesis monooxygenase [Candidatus Dormibacteraeota bacterium]MBJ7611158.1 antibiotic biosynthesis monooxygenase [Candidatus Dormibacteraeota bacterium]PZR90664.1 MAG: antibiotic biosynthesis monooxygenase [Candidatus Dormibacteraeota bacterium]
MTTISPEQPVVTLINVFTVEPDNQNRLVDLLVEATKQVMSHLPGFVSANIHRGLDGRHVANYAQWESPEAFQRMLGDPEARPHMAQIRELATNEGYLYEVLHVEGRPPG